MTHIVYILTMPNKGSWNGQWTGDRDLFCIVKSYKAKSEIPSKVLSMKSGYYYDFRDGWGANINAEEITAKEKTKYRKRSKGFYGYEWMVEEIEQFGRIKTFEERNQERRLDNPYGK